MRLIAVPLPQTLADERRRRARTDRDKRLNHSEDYYALLSWTLLLTNLPAASLPVEQMLALYALRWRIDPAVAGVPGRATCVRRSPACIAATSITWLSAARAADMADNGRR